MSLWRRIAGLFGAKAATDTRRRIHARFDAAGNHPETRRHWAQADGLAADAAASPGVRAILRNRGRHEQFNNAYLFGAIHTLANDCVGIGPQLQLLTDSDVVNQAVETKFHQWARAVGLADKMRLMRRTRAATGECFAIFVRNPRVADPVKLDLRIVEGDQVSRPMLTPDDPDNADGIEFDSFGNPTFYNVLKRHPGDTFASTPFPGEHDRLPAAAVIHYFRAERPGQRRGVPEIASGLNLNAQRRAYRESVLAASRRVAEMGAVALESEAGADQSEEATPFETLETEHGLFTALPSGMTMKQIEPMQPGTNYAEFDNRLINEQGRSLVLPRGVALGDSSEYNYASARADGQPYDRMQAIDRDELERIALSRILAEWSIEATAIPNHLPGRAGQVYLPTRRDPEYPVVCQWFWGDRPHVDPGKEASAEATKLETHTTTLTEAYARQRKDWRTQVEQSGREREALDDAGLVTVDATIAPHVLAALQNVATIGVESTVELLTVLGVSRKKAERMATAAERDAAPPPTPAPSLTSPAPAGDDVPPAIAARMNGSHAGNGKGATHAGN